MRLLVRPLILFVMLASAVAGTAQPASAATCGKREASTPFAPWGDPALYFLAPNGDFESGTRGWTLGGGARIVEGNEPFYVTSPADRHSLLVPSGGWAETAPFCVDRDEPTIRFFVRGTGSALSTLRVLVTIRTTVLGRTIATTLPLAGLPGLTTGAWQPSLPVLVGLSVNQLLGGTTTVSVRFVSGGDWQIDDVYVDPFKDW